MLNGTDTLPHSIETERAILGACMIEPVLLDEVASRCRPEHFHVERHRLIFEGMLKVGAASLDLRTLQAELERVTGWGGTFGGLAYLTGLDLDLPDVGRIQLYIDVLLERFQRRGGIAAAQRLLSDLTSKDQPVEDLFAAASQALDKLQIAAAGEGYKHAVEGVEAVLASLERERGEIRGLLTGLPRVDRYLLGMARGEVYYIAARPGDGKTTFMVQIALHAAIHQRQTVGIVSLEMPQEQLAERMISHLSGVSGARIRANTLDPDESALVHRCGQQIGKLDLWIDDAGSQTAQSIAARSRTLHRRHSLGLLLVDYIGLMKVPQRSEKRTYEIAEISREMKALAKELSVPIVVLAQLTRESAKNGRPTLSDIADSDAPAKDAAGVIFVWPNAENGKRTDQGIFLIPKNRFGPCGEVPYVFDGKRYRFFEGADHGDGDAPTGWRERE